MKDMEADIEFLQEVKKSVRDRLPEGTAQTIDDYVNHRFKPGSFVEAVLSNDLADAMARADIDNRAKLFEIVGYVFRYVPMHLWGSREKVRAHLRGE